MSLLACIIVLRLGYEPNYMSLLACIIVLRLGYEPNYMSLDIIFSRYIRCSITLHG